MNGSISPVPFRLRGFGPQDIPDFVETVNLSYPDEPTTVELQEYWEGAYPKDNPRLRFVAEWESGKAVGFGTCLNPFWMETPGAYWLELLVHPDYRRRGIGVALLEACEPFGWQQGARRLWSNCREDHGDGVAFAERHGYHTIGIRFESALDLETFDETPFASSIARFRESGYTLSTLAAERQTTADADRRLFELHDEVMADVPFPGGAYPKTTYEQWRSWALDNPSSDPDAMFIAKHGSDWVGLTMLEIPPSGSPFTGSTGVVRSHRGRGVATTLKLASFRYLRERGQTEVRAHNDTANPPILHINEKLGYHRLPGWLSWEKLRS